MYTAAELWTFTTANLTEGGWYLNCPLTFTHLDETEFRKSFNGPGAIDLDVPEFAELIDQQKKRAIARRMVANKKKKAKEEEIRTNKK